MKICKKAVALLLTLLMIFSLLPMTVLADSVAGVRIESVTVGETKKYAAFYPGATDKLVPYVKDLDAFRDYLFGQFYNSKSKISISSYKIPYSQSMINAIWALKEDEMLEIFHIKQIQVFSDNTGRYLNYIQPVYTYSASKYKDMMAKVEKSAAVMLEGIKGNSALGDVEKALLLHDRLALFCDYDYANLLTNTLSDNVYNMYGALVDGMAVCQGYAEAYDYLLESVGIESEICASDKLNHAWNIVTIGGVKYHVDVTWDDPVTTKSWDVQGEVLHNNFLLSSNALFYGVNGSQGHNAYDYETTPKSTKYDNYFWQRSDTAFQLIDNQIYYMDNDSAQLKRYSDKSVLVNINAESDKWYGYSINFSRLTSDGKYLYFSTGRNIYKYNPKNGELVKLFTLNLSSNYSIYGFEYVGNDFIYDVNTSANFNSNTMYRYKKEYDMAPPTMESTSTYGPTASQTITLTMKDNSGIDGYWFGNNSDYNLNTYYKTTSDKVTIKISAPGTYYIVVKDVYGNISEKMHYFVYSKITLNPNGGSVTTKSIVTVNNCNFKLPTPTRPGYIFKGWAISKTAKSGVTNINPTSDKTYYAIWKANTTPSLYKVNGVWYYYKNGKINKSNTIVKYNNKWYHVNNGKWVKDTTLVKYGSSYIYVKNGLKNTSNTLVKYKNKLYHVKNGKWVKDTAIVKFSGKRYYVKGGVVQKVTKTVKVNGKYYRIKKGIVS